MPHDILMPQLGMAQDSAVIVSWLKELGEAVAADDPLMEVETDKATVEVPAGKDGFLVEIRAAAGDEIPVGDIIAVISKSVDDVKDTPAPAKSEPPEPVPDAQPVTEPIKPEAPKVMARQTSATIASPPAAGGRILASPKARMQAHQRGIDLNALARQGVAQPIHAADLDKNISSGPSLSVLAAAANGDALASLLNRETEPTQLRRKVFAAFACGALRHATGWENTQITVECNGLDGDIQWLTNPDQSGIANLGFEMQDNSVDLALYDLTQTHLTEYRPASGSLAQLSAANDGHGGFRLTLSFSEVTLPVETAAAFLDNFAARIEDPIRHIL